MSGAAEIRVLSTVPLSSPGMNWMAVMITIRKGTTEMIIQKVAEAAKTGISSFRNFCMILMKVIRFFMGLS